MMQEESHRAFGHVLATPVEPSDEAPEASWSHRGSPRRDRVLELLGRSSSSMRARPKRLEGVPSSRRSAQPSAGSLRCALHVDLLELLGEE